MTSDTGSENKSEKKSQPGFLARFLQIWGIVSIAGIGPFVFQFGLLRIWIFLLVGAGISLLLALIWPLFYKRAAAQDIPRIQEWRQAGNILELIKYLNTHAANSLSPVWNEAVKAVIEMGPSVVPNLIEALSTETSYVPYKSEAENQKLLNLLRVNMAYCLGEIGDKSAIPSLKSTLKKYQRKNSYQDKLVKAQVEAELVKLGVSKEEIERIKKEKSE